MTWRPGQQGWCEAVTTLPLVTSKPRPQGILPSYKRRCSGNTLVTPPRSARRVPSFRSLHVAATAPPLTKWCGLGRRRGHLPTYTLHVASRPSSPLPPSLPAPAASPCPSRPRQHYLPLPLQDAKQCRTDTQVCACTSAVFGSHGPGTSRRWPLRESFGSEGAREPDLPPREKSQIGRSYTAESPPGSMDRTNR